MREGDLPGWFYQVLVLLSALLFAVMAALAKVLMKEGNVQAPVITFWRFLIGWLVLLLYLVVARPRMAPRRIGSLVLRGVFNVSAVFLFYYSIKYTTITNANLLNLTYPAFVAILGPLILGEVLRGRDWLLLVIAGVGVLLVVNPNFSRINVGDLFGLGSGLSGGLAMIVLRRARQANSTVTVLTFLLTIGVLMTFPAALHEDFSRYSGRIWVLVIACSALGVAGQFLLTMAFRHVSAFAGSVTGMSRVVIAAFIGTVCLGEVLPWHVVLGAAVLGAAIAGLTSKQRGVVRGTGATR